VGSAGEAVGVAARECPAAQSDRGDPVRVVAVAVVRGRQRRGNKKGKKKARRKTRRRSPREAAEC
jgi:hypothetical protein